MELHCGIGDVLVLVATMGCALGFFHLLAYSGTNSDTTGATAQDLTAVTDSEFSQRNNHYIFTEDYRILALYTQGTAITRASINSPQFNAFTNFNIWPVNVTSVPLSPPRLDYWLDVPVLVPKDEEVQTKCNSTASDTFTTLLKIAPQNWMRNLPRGMGPVPQFECRFTCTPTLNGKNWCSLAQMSFEQSLRGGVYSVLGVQFQGAGLIAGRLVFPRAPFYQNRKLRPGTLASIAIGDQPIRTDPIMPFTWGEWGRFSTFEPPQLEFIGNGSGTPSVEGRMWLSYLTSGMDVQY